MSTETLADLIRADDPDAIAGFRDAHIAKVRAYCEVACSDGSRDDAVGAAFVEFLGRVSASEGDDGELEQLLRKATRSAAAGRFEIVAPANEALDAGQTPAIDPICLAIPELLAADANLELPGVDAETLAHVERCHTCAATKARADAAEQAFADTDAFADGPQATAGAPSEPATTSLRPPISGLPPAPAPTVMRARRGGLVGAARRLLRSRNS